ncbi:uncharacterized protein B0T15DRAFT_514033 [Chaetomium strumarium]|uniref:Uncharacterized protein n=1 Tax=Chaetomium strumarium TaxID=1170767 RepID=A0AAJ0GL91_9PEZI|nr:hypothetical protein B0T15DRAFT_514033 [Chaetomium strumarium]
MDKSCIKKASFHLICPCLSLAPLSLPHSSQPRSFEVTANNQDYKDYIAEPSPSVVQTPAQKPPARQQRAARLISTAGPKFNASFGDPADEFILRKACSRPSVKSSPGRGKAQNRG